MNDTIKLFDSIVPFKYELNSMSWNNLNLNFNNKNFVINNELYPLWQAFNKKLLDNPLKILVNTKKFIIIQDTNYKKMFNIPIDILKGIDAYMTIDKIKVVDNYISSNDYHLTFGTLNERYIINGSGEIQINKIINKFEHGLRLLIEVFNISHTTGAYNTNLLIYYSLNGVQFVESADIFYDVVLPNVLDNEYLLIDIDRLDYTPPTFTSKDKRGNIIKSNSRSDVFEGYKNIFLGTPGCIGSDFG